MKDTLPHGLESPHAVKQTCKRSVVARTPFLQLTGPESSPKESLDRGMNPCGRRKSLNDSAVNSPQRSQNDSIGLGACCPSDNVALQWPHSRASPSSSKFVTIEIPPYMDQHRSLGQSSSGNMEIPPPCRLSQQQPSQRHNQFPALKQGGGSFDAQESPVSRHAELIVPVSENEPVSGIDESNVVFRKPPSPMTRASPLPQGQRYSGGASPERNDRFFPGPTSSNPVLAPAHGPSPAHRSTWFPFVAPAADGEEVLPQFNTQSSLSSSSGSSSKKQELPVTQNTVLSQTTREGQRAVVEDMEEPVLLSMDTTSGSGGSREDGSSAMPTTSNAVQLSPDDGRCGLKAQAMVKRTVLLLVSREPLSQPPRGSASPPMTQKPEQTPLFDRNGGSSPSTPRKTQCDRAALEASYIVRHRSHYSPSTTISSVEKDETSVSTHQVKATGSVVSPSSDGAGNDSVIVDHGSTISVTEASTVSALESAPTATVVISSEEQENMETCCHSLLSGVTEPSRLTRYSNLLERCGEKEKLSPHFATESSSSLSLNVGTVTTTLASPLSRIANNAQEEEIMTARVRLQNSQASQCSHSQHTPFFFPAAALPHAPMPQQDAEDAEVFQREERASHAEGKSGSCCDISPSVECSGFAETACQKEVYFVRSREESETSSSCESVCAVEASRDNDNGSQSVELLSAGPEEKGDRGVTKDETKKPRRVRVRKRRRSPCACRSRTSLSASLSRSPHSPSSSADWPTDPDVVREVTAEDIAREQMEKEAELLGGLTGEQKRVWCKVVRDGRSVFITGGAGTGKSYLLMAIIKGLPVHTTFVTATTGIAALNLGGTTLHSFSGCGLVNPHTDTYMNVYYNASRSRQVVDNWRRCEVLIIDEVSMLDGWLFEALEACARRIRHSRLPFGGIQLVLTGDFLQLPPVNRSLSTSANSGGQPPVLRCNDNRGLFPTTTRLAFETQAWCRVNPSVCVLMQHQRQKDSYFFRLLNDIRHGETGVDVVREMRNCSTLSRMQQRKWKVDGTHVGDGGDNSSIASSMAVEAKKEDGGFGRGALNREGVGEAGFVKREKRTRSLEGSDNRECVRASPNRSMETGANGSSLTELGAEQVITEPNWSKRQSDKPPPGEALAAKKKTSATGHSSSSAALVNSLPMERTVAPSAIEEKLYVQLRSLRRAVDDVNEARFTKLRTPIHQYYGAHTGKGNFPDALPDVVSLRVGCKVMLLKNINLSAGLGNGSIGTVVGFRRLTDVNYSEMSNYRETRLDMEIMAHTSIYRSNRFGTAEGDNLWGGSGPQFGSSHGVGRASALYKGWSSVRPALRGEKRYSGRRRPKGDSTTVDNGNGKSTDNGGFCTLYPTEQLAEPPRLDKTGRLNPETLMIPVVLFNVRKLCTITKGVVEEARQVIVGPQRWTQNEGDQEVSCSIQIPLRLAYAITIHKSQGMSISHVSIDFEGIFEKGQTYVALSRSTTLANLIVDNFKVDYVQPNSCALSYYYAVRAYQRYMKLLKKQRIKEQQKGNQGAALAQPCDANPAAEQTNCCPSDVPEHAAEDHKVDDNVVEGEGCDGGTAQQLPTACCGGEYRSDSKATFPRAPWGSVARGEPNAPQPPPWGDSMLHNFPPKVIRAVMNEKNCLPLICLNKPIVVTNEPQRAVEIGPAALGDPTEEEEHFLDYNPSAENEQRERNSRVNQGGRDCTKASLSDRLVTATKMRPNHQQPRGQHPRQQASSYGSCCQNEHAIDSRIGAFTERDPSSRGGAFVAGGATVAQLAPIPSWTRCACEETNSGDDCSSVCYDDGVGRRVKAKRPNDSYRWTQRHNASKVYSSDLIVSSNDTTQIERLRRLFVPIFEARAGIRRRVLVNIQSALHIKDALLVVDLSSLCLLASSDPTLTGATSAMYNHIFHKNNNMMRVSMSLRQLLVTAASSSAKSSSVSTPACVGASSERLCTQEHSAPVAAADDSSVWVKQECFVRDMDDSDKQRAVEQHLQSSGRCDGSQPQSASMTNCTREDGYSAAVETSSDYDDSQSDNDFLESFTQLVSTWSMSGSRELSSPMILPSSQCLPRTCEKTSTNPIREADHVRCRPTALDMESATAASSVSMPTPTPPPIGMTLTSRMASDVLLVLESAQREFILDEQRDDECFREYSPRFVAPEWEAYISAIEHVQPCHPYIHDMLSYAMYLGMRYTSVVVVMTESIDVASRAMWMGLPVCSVDYLAQRVNSRKHSRIALGAR